MKNSNLLLRISAALVLITFCGHTFGTIAPIPTEQSERAGVYKIMSTTLVSMPMGSPKTYAQILLGANLCVSVLLLLSSLIYFALAKAETNRFSTQMNLLNSLAMFFVSFFSILYFFPLPALFTGVAAVLGFINLKMNSNK